MPKLSGENIFLDFFPPEMSGKKLHKVRKWWYYLETIHLGNPNIKQESLCEEFAVILFVYLLKLFDIRVFFILKLPLWDLEIFS
jgi:hypothetical protein